MKVGNFGKNAVSVENLRSMFNTDGEGKFTTLCDDTRGQIYLKDGQLHNVGRHWIFRNCKAPTTIKENFELRQKVVDAFRNKGVTPQFLKYVEKQLGLNLVQGKGADPCLSLKPLSRRTIKKILKVYDRYMEKAAPTTPKGPESVSKDVRAQRHNGGCVVGQFLKLLVPTLQKHCRYGLNPNKTVIFGDNHPNLPEAAKQIASAHLMALQYEIRKVALQVQRGEITCKAAFGAIDKLVKANLGSKDSPVIVNEDDYKQHIAPLLVALGHKLIVVNNRNEAVEGMFKDNTTKKNGLQTLKEQLTACGVSEDVINGVVNNTKEMAGKVATFALGHRNAAKGFKEYVAHLIASALPKHLGNQVISKGIAAEVTKSFLRKIKTMDATTPKEKSSKERVGTKINPNNGRYVQGGPPAKAALETLQTESTMKKLFAKGDKLKLLNSKVKPGNVESLKALLKPNVKSSNERIGTKLHPNNGRYVQKDSLAEGRQAEAWKMLGDDLQKRLKGFLPQSYDLKTEVKRLNDPDKKKVMEMMMANYASAENSVNQELFIKDVVKIIYSARSGEKVDANYRKMFNASAKSLLMVGIPQDKRGRAGKYIEAALQNFWHEINKMIAPKPEVKPSNEMREFDQFGEEFRQLFNGFGNRLTSDAIKACKQVLLNCQNTAKDTKATYGIINKDAILKAGWRQFANVLSQAGFTQAERNQVQPRFAKAMRRFLGRL